MFTGIIEGLGKIVDIRPAGQGKSLIISTDFSLDYTKTGDSISVSGACLTVVELKEKRFRIDMSSETFSVTTFKNARLGEPVNIERALRLSDRLDGHLVSGHIDGTGTIKNKKTVDNSILITIGVPEALTRYIIRKGSVAVDGISLTVNACGKNSFDVSIIPHTAMLTTIGFKKTGALVNIETDMIGKYIERFAAGASENNKDNRLEKIDRQFLAKTGFI